MTKEAANDKPRKVVLTDYDYPSLTPITAELDALGVEFIAANCRTAKEIVELCRDADVVITEHYKPIDRDVMSAMTRCRAIIRTGIGFDTIDIEAASDLGIDVVNIPAYALDEVSDHALALLLTCVRKIPLLNEAVKGGVWDFKIAQPVPRIRGKTIGIVGLGRIGQMFAPKAAALGLHVIAYDPYHDPAATNSIRMVSFATLLRESDFVSIHAPLTEETEGMFDGAALRAMKPTAYLINTARGPIVRLDALYGALTEGWIAGAGLDVVEAEPINPSHRILRCANLVVTPHFGWYSEGAMHELLQTVGQEAARVLRGERPLSVVNAEPQKSPHHTARA